MSRRNSGVGLGTIIFHTIMTLITGGFWLIPLGIWFLVSNSRRK